MPARASKSKIVAVVFVILSMEKRRSPRLTGFDYAAGGFFVTICTLGPAAVYGHLANGELVPSALGTMVERTWYELPGVYPEVLQDTFVVMPDHVHATLCLLGHEPSVDSPGHARPLSLPAAIQRFKSVTTRRYLDGVRDGAWAAGPSKLWQRSYFDRAIRTERELEDVRRYILDNPRRTWERLTHAGTGGHGGPPLRSGLVLPKRQWRGP